MKKLLLASLLLVGATSFGAVTGELQSGSGEASLPVRVKGTVVNTTNKTLVVTPLTNTSADGAALEFSFGNIAASSTQKLSGDFKVELMQTNKVIDFTGSGPSAELIANGASSSNTHTSQLTPVHIKYDLSSLTKQADKSYRGTLDIAATAQASQSGAFTDTAVSIKVNVTGEN